MQACQSQDQAEAQFCIVSWKQKVVFWGVEPMFANAAGQSQWERPSGGSLNQPFVPCLTFSGAQEGYYFSMGPKGLGYYKDEPGSGLILAIATGWARQKCRPIPPSSSWTTIKTSSTVESPPSECFTAHGMFLSCWGGAATASKILFKMSAFSLWKYQLTQCRCQGDIDVNTNAYTFYQASN